jgi:L-aminoadipate-semialdehyde dehydrogenase
VRTPAKRLHYIYNPNYFPYRFPLLHFVLDNLPSSTKAPELDDSNTVVSLKKDSKWTKEDCSQGAGVGVQTMGIYIAYLIAIGFLPPPPQKGELETPNIELSKEEIQGLQAIGGRGAVTG